ncbi:helix-turn-helix domain-containing protein [Sphingobium sp. WTD-1]|uniref:helix-turn-helix domain-containing protein n=1 Tax=Sphingobium sp. WTD-1 TaxID=2979467 RepID=UPI0024DE3230|nr:helix-turn-helix domain-containing protein [Sphingobium sp. WTD-1]WIA55174.1 helix-turn-helix domain-containing protein [Sphingobium sp. WTD-1]
MTETPEYRKATAEEKQRIEQLAAEGKPLTAIAKEVGFSQTYVGKIVRQSKQRLWIEHRRAIDSHERSLANLAEKIERNTRAIERQTRYLKLVMGRVSMAINGVTKTREVLKNIQARITKLIQNEEKQQTLRQSIWGKKQ